MILIKRLQTAVLRQHGCHYCVLSAQGAVVGGDLLKLINRQRRFFIKNKHVVLLMRSVKSAVTSCLRMAATEARRKNKNG